MNAMNALQAGVQKHPPVPVVVSWGNRAYDLREIALWLLEDPDERLTGERVHDRWTDRRATGSGGMYLLSADLYVSALTLIARVGLGKTWQPQGRITMDLKAVAA